MLDTIVARREKHGGHGIVVSTSIRPLIAPLFVPGDRPERFAKAAASGADAVILDLEDAVAAERKAYARECIRSHGLDGSRTIIRVNARTSPWFEADLAALREIPIAALMLPKVEHAGDIAAIQAALQRTVSVIPLIESAAGLAGLTDILGAPGVCMAALGSIDYALDLGCAHAWEPLLPARAELVLRSRLAGLAAPLDGVTTAIDDPIAVAHDARRAADLGFGGKLAIHPRQIAPISHAFRPDEAAVSWAQRVIATADTGAARSLDGEMIDRPVMERARRILARMAKPDAR